MLPKKYRLPAKDFRYVYAKGLKIRGVYGMLISVSSDRTRFGFVINKKIGNAVKRHKMTRLLRVIVMQMVEELQLDSSKHNFEYVAFEYCDDIKVLREELLAQFKKTLK